MEGSGNKRRVLLIEGKRLVEGDPNLVTENEILLKPVVTEGKQSYMLVDNKGTVLSSAPVTPEDNWLYIYSEAFDYVGHYTAVCKTLDDYEQFVKQLASNGPSAGLVIHNDEPPFKPETYTLVFAPSETIEDTKRKLKNICKGLPASDGPFIAIFPQTYPINYLRETDYYIGSLIDYPSRKAGAVYDRENDIWKEVTYEDV
jgi:hypothetical protein